MNVEFYYIALMVERLPSHPLSYDVNEFYLNEFCWLWGITNRSDKIGLEYGVPHGSILLSFLSIVMVNKLPSFDCRVHKYTIGAIC